MTDSTPASEALGYDPDALTSTTETDAYRSAAIPSDMGGFRYHVTRMMDAENGIPEDADSWEIVSTSDETYPTAEEAREHGRLLVFELIGENTVTVERADGLFERVVAGATGAGLDPSGWTFGQLAGLSWMIYDTRRNQLGLWGSLDDAWTGMYGMANAFELVARHRDEVRQALARDTMKIVEKSGLFHVIGPDGWDYGRRATREQAEGLLTWLTMEATGQAATAPTQDDPAD